MKNVTLSKDADEDLENIFDYTHECFGLEQAIRYVTQFDNVFKTISDNPKVGRQRSEIRKGLRSLPKDQHIIFYRLLKDHIRIVRILHGSCDLPKFLD